MDKTYIIGQANIANDPTAVKFTAQTLTSEQKVQAQTNIGLNDIQLVKTNDLEYELRVGGVSAGTINIPKDQFLKSVEFNPDTKILTFVFTTSTGDVTTTIDMSALIDVYTAGNGLLLVGNQFSINLDGNSNNSLTISADGLMLDKTQFTSTSEFENLSEEVTENAAQIETLNSNYVKSPVETGASLSGQNTLANAQPTFSVESNNRFDYDNAKVGLAKGTYSKIENGYTATGAQGGSWDAAWDNGWFAFENVALQVGEIFSFDYNIVKINVPDYHKLVVALSSGVNGQDKSVSEGETGRIVYVVKEPSNGNQSELNSIHIALSSMTVEITNICISKVTDTYTPYLTDGTAVTVNISNSDSETNQIVTSVGQNINFAQYDDVTNITVATSGAVVSGQFILSTQYELNDKLTPLFGTFATRPTTTQPYAILYIATDQTGENKVTILPANTDGSVSGNWISI